MVLFHERYPADKELSDKISDEDYAKSVKAQIKRFHHHKDGSPVELQMVADRQLEFARAQKEQAQQAFTEEQRAVERAIEQEVVQKGKPILFMTCNCGQNLMVTQKGNQLDVAYMKAQNSESTYAGSEGLVEYGNDEGNIEYSSSSGNVEYGGN